MLEYPVAAVVLTYNDVDLTGKCVASLNRQQGLNLKHVIIVDNGSTKETVEDLRRLLAQYRNTSCLFLKQNLGFAAGMNRGIEEALKRGSQFVLVLNNDTELARDAGAAMLRCAVGEHPAGIVSPKIVLWDDPNTLWYAGSKWGLPFHKHRGYGQPDNGQYNRRMQISFASGCAAMISSAALQEAGMFDERFFFGMEDRELSNRYRRHGLGLWYEPAAVVKHKVSATRDKLLAPERIYLGYLSQLFYLRVVSHPVIWVFWYLLYLGHLLLVVPHRLLRVGTDRHMVAANWKAGLRAWLGAWGANDTYSRGGLSRVTKDA